jgi:hypothetical protein
MVDQNLIKKNMNWINKNIELPKENETVLIWYSFNNEEWPELVEFINKRFIRNIKNEWEDDFTEDIQYWSRITKPK